LERDRSPDEHAGHNSPDLQHKNLEPTGHSVPLRMIRIFPLLISFLILTNWVIPIYGQDQVRSRIKDIAIAELPSEARTTLQLIEKGGPFPYQRDGAVFGNFERRLPLKQRGYYREFTVPTPGRRDRGARRIVAGEDGECYYTEDHYRTFRKIRKGSSR
jgi:ribonuclease T1